MTMTSPPCKIKQKTHKLLLFLIDKLIQSSVPYSTIRVVSIRSRGTSILVTFKLSAHCAGFEEEHEAISIALLSKVKLSPRYTIPIHIRKKPRSRRMLGY